MGVMRTQTPPAVNPPAAVNPYVPKVHPKGIQLTPWQHIDVTTDIPNIFLVQVTPECARKWLEHDLRNRPRRPANYAVLRRDAENNRMGLTGDAISFCSKFLISGGHRLDVVRDTETTQTFFVAVGLLETTRHFTDQAARFSPSDSMRFEGHADPRSMAGLVGAVNRLEADGSVRKRGGSVAKASNNEQLDFLAAHPEMTRYLQVARQISKTLEGKETSTVIGLCLWMFTRGQDHPGAAMEFLRLVQTPANIDDTHPAYVLNRAILSPKYNKTGQSEFSRVGMFITAWNSWVQGKPIRRVGLWPEHEKQLPEVLHPGPQHPARMLIPAPLPEDFPAQQSQLEIVLRS